jgi:hypothetical protein
MTDALGPWVNRTWALLGASSLYAIHHHLRLGRDLIKAGGMNGGRPRFVGLLALLDDLLWIALERLDSHFGRGSAPKDVVELKGHRA